MGILPFGLLFQIISVILLGTFIFVIVLVIRALKKYLKSSTVKNEEEIYIKKTLGETLKEYRINNKMTQEFVAESLGVSRQAVSKWESGATEPSTSNLIALSKLYKVSADEILRNIK